MIQYTRSIKVIKQSIQVAFNNLFKHSKTVEKYFDNLLNYTVTLNQEALVKQWREKYTVLESLPIHKSFQIAENADKKYLSDWINVPQLEQISKEAVNLGEIVEKKLRDLKMDLDKANTDGFNLAVHSSKTFEGDYILDDTSYNEIITEIETLTQKVERESDYVSSLPESLPNMRNAFRVISLHQTEFLPQIQTLVRELRDLQQQWLKRKADCITTSIEFLRSIGEIQQNSGEIKNSMVLLRNDLGVAHNYRTMFARVVDMPLLYGSTLIEILRRNKWVLNTKQNVQDISETFAEIREFEIKRRQNWDKEIGMNLPCKDAIPNVNLFSVDITINEANNESLNVTENDVSEFIQKLKSNTSWNDITIQLEKQLQNLSTPSSGSNTMKKKRNLLRESLKHNDLNISNYFSSAINLDSELSDERVRSYESRIRRLEDLLHQRRVRNLSGGPITPETDPHRLSFAMNSETEDFQNRITALKEVHLAEMTALKDQIGELSDENKKLKEENSEKDSSNKSLLETMTTQESEYAKEKQVLLDEIEELKQNITKQEIEKNLEEDIKELTNEKTILQEENEKLSAAVDFFQEKSKDLTEKLYNGYQRSCLTLESIGLMLVKDDGIDGKGANLKIIRVKGLGKSRRNSTTISSSIEHVVPPGVLNGSLFNPGTTLPLFSACINDSALLYWMDSPSKEEQTNGYTNGTTLLESKNKGKELNLEIMENRFNKFINGTRLDYDMFKNSIDKRFHDVEHLARKLTKESKYYREKNHTWELESKFKVAIRLFKIGDLVLFLPTRDGNDEVNKSNNIPQKQPWAAFNVGAPHFFLQEEITQRLVNRDWMLGRIKKIQERVVTKDNISQPSDNPFSLSLGIRWYYIDAEEEIGLM